MKYFSFKNTYEVNKALYRQLVKDHHPDKFDKAGEVKQKAAKEAFQKIQAEWELYDRMRKDAVTGDKKEAYDSIFSNMNFNNMKEEDVVKFYETNKDVIEEAVNRFVFKKKANREMDQELIRFGYALGKSIFDLFNK